ncbi:MAG TPA: SpaA isopeptide-forming pilin-related protein, partial [Acidimicrobiales bacterium]
QFPGFAYCVVEHAAPADYLLDQSPHCTPVLVGTSTRAAPVTTLTVTDTEAAVTLFAHKYNSLDPDTVIPGATYDLYVEGSAPPSGVPSTMPPDAATEAGDTWYARRTTNQSGDLSFTVPAGYAWCLAEHAAPVDYQPDPALHCTAVLTSTSTPGDLTVALPETLATVHISATKFNSLQPDTEIPGATYELLEQGSAPSGYPTAAPPTDDPVPAGDTYWGQGTTGTNGVLTFAVPAGHSWCLHELTAPAGYQPDVGYHCTAVLTTDTSAAAASIALPEIPTPGQLPFTGGPGLLLVGGSLLLVTGGNGLWLLGRRSRRGPVPS